MRKIFVVDDEHSILTLLQYNLESEGYQVATCADGREAYDQILTEEFDFIILDVMLPGLDGMDICRRIRKEGIQTPILMLTAKDGEYDKIVGLELGADDYMTKPFSPREVVARIKAIFRRTEARDARDAQEADRKHAEAAQIELSQLQDQVVTEEEQTIRLGDLEINTQYYEVRVAGQEVDITPKEFELLVYMALRKDRILSREQLLNGIWNFDYSGETRIVDVHVSHLRDKIEKDSKNPQYIKTVRGFGYKFEVPEA